ncbi:hypothetical protein D3C78_1967300 [compost metagenome]
MVQAFQVLVAQMVLEAIAAQQVGNGVEGVAGNQDAVALVIGNAGDAVHSLPPTIL